MKLKNKTIKIAAVIASLTLILTGCSNNIEQINNSKSNSKHRLFCLVLDKGTVNDHSFNSSAWAGAQDAAEEFGVEVKYLESNTDADYESNIETAIDMDADLIIGVGFNLSQAINNAALSYPDKQFAIVDGSFDKIPENVTPIVFDEKEAGYLAGIAAAKSVNSDIFGFVGGYKVPAVINYRDGFEAGLKEINPNAILHTQYANSFTDAAKGRSIANQLISKENVSLIVASGGCVNTGIFEVCKEKGIYSVAVDSAQSYMHPETILTSALKRVDTGVKDTIKTFIDGELKGGINLTYNIINNGVGYEKTKLISDETISYIDAKITSKA